MTTVDSIKDVVRSSVKIPVFDKHLKKAGGHIGRNVVEITIKMKTIVRKPLMIKSSINDHNAASTDFPDSLDICLSSIASGRSSSRYPVSVQYCC